MALRPIVRLGDKTSHGGTVLEGFSTYSVYGKPACGLGHMVSCPMCKGSFPIIEGASTFTVNGIAVAVQGMRTGCGARLIASQKNSDPNHADATLDCEGTLSTPHQMATLPPLLGLQQKILPKQHMTSIFCSLMSKRDNRLCMCTTKYLWKTGTPAKVSLTNTEKPKRYLAIRRST